MICTAGADQCRVLRRDEMLPAWPRFSPDGSKMAYVKLRNDTPRLMAFSVSGRTRNGNGRHALAVSARLVVVEDRLGFEGSAGRYAWVEKEVETGLRTGRRSR